MSDTTTTTTTTPGVLVTDPATLKAGDRISFTGYDTRGEAELRGPEPDSLYLTARTEDGLVWVIRERFGGWSDGISDVRLLRQPNTVTITREDNPGPHWNSSIEEGVHTLILYPATLSGPEGHGLYLCAVRGADGEPHKYGWELRSHDEFTARGVDPIDLPPVGERCWNVSEELFAQFDPKNADTTTPTPEETEVERLRRELARVQGEADEARRRHVEDIERISDVLNEEANERGWCGEYDSIAGNLSDRLHIGLTPRTREYEVEVIVTYRITKTVTASDEDGARQAAEEEFDTADLTYETPDIEVDGVDIA